MRTVLRVIPDLLKVLKELLKWLPLLKDLLEELRKYRWRHTGDAPANSGRTVIVKPDAEGDNRTLPIRRLVCMDLRKWIEAAQDSSLRQLPLRPSRRVVRVLRVTAAGSLSLLSAFRPIVLHPVRDRLLCLG